MMYSSSGAYRKTKIFIDYATIVLAFLILIAFLLLMFFRNEASFLFVLVLFLGFLVNGLQAIKHFINHELKTAITSGAFALILVIFAIMCFIVEF